MSSTICALATPPGAGGIAVVRVSGPEAYAVVGEIFTPRNPAKQVAEAKGYTAMLGHYHLRGWMRPSPCFSARRTATLVRM